MKRTPRLLLATHNPGKLTEMRALLGAIPFELVTLRDLGITLVAAETTGTYLGNALAKGRAYAAASGLPTLADDSGLEIDALPGELGVESASFGAPDMPYPERNTLILARLAHVPPEQRTARYRCVMALCAPPPGSRATSVVGIVEGAISGAPRGTNGFGYDPIFLLPERGQTLAELPLAEKNRLSHRAAAARQMAAVLRRWPDVWP